MRPFLFALTVCLFSTSAFAEVFRYVDAQGNVIFTDNPPEQVEAQPITIPPTNTLPAPTPLPPMSMDNSTQESTQRYSQLELNVPNDEAIRANNGSFNVTVNITPDLLLTDSLQLLVDDMPYGQPLRSLQLPLVNLDRGEHTLAVQVLSGNQVIQQSAAKTVFVMRTSLNSPTRRGGN